MPPRRAPLRFLPPPNFAASRIQSAWRRKRATRVEVRATDPGTAVVRNNKQIKRNMYNIGKINRFLRSLVSYSTWYKSSTATLGAAKLNLVPLIVPGSGGAYGAWQTCFQNDTSEVGVEKTGKLNKVHIKMTCQTDNNVPPATWNVLIIKPKYNNTMDANTNAPLLASDITLPQDYVGTDRIMMNRKRWTVLGQRSFVLGHSDLTAQGGTIQNIVTNFRDIRRDISFTFFPRKYYLRDQDGSSWQGLTAEKVPRHQQIYLLWYVNKGVVTPDNDVSVRYTALFSMSEKS